MSELIDLYNEELNLLFRAIRSERFRFIIVQYNHYDIIENIVEQFQELYPNRKIHRLDFEKFLNPSLVNDIFNCNSGFILMEHFEQLFKDENKEIALGFNQHRDKFKDLPLILVAFLPWDNNYLQQFAKSLPDIYSIVNPFIQLKKKLSEFRASLDNELINHDYLSFNNSEDALNEIKRIEKRLSELNDNPENLRLKFLLNNQLGHSYFFIANYQKAKLIYQSLLSEPYLNAGFPDISLIQSNLANVYRELGEYNKARDLLENAIATEIIKNGEPQPSVAIHQATLAEVYRLLGEYKKARDLLEKSLVTYTANFGKQHPNVALCQSSLANVYGDMGENEKARDLLEKALTSNIENFGKQHPNVAAVQSNLALIYYDLAEYKKARDLLENALASDIANFGKHNPNVAMSQTNLAAVYQNLGEFEKAKNLLEKALASDKSNFGEDHPYVANKLNNLATVYYSLGEIEKAKELFRRAYAICIKTFGENHPNTKTIKAWLDKIEME